MGNNNSSSAAKGGTDIPTDDDDGGGDGGEHALIVAAEANDAAEIRRLHGLGADLGEDVPLAAVELTDPVVVDQHPAPLEGLALD